MAHISIQNLTVEFAIYGTHARSLKNMLMAQATGGRIMAGARDVVSVRAIDNLSLEIKDGDRIGLVGHNGSGKTTLLRVLAGIYKPTGGRIEIAGRVGALLESHAGMDPESTGIENIYLRGTLLGLSRAEIRDRIPEIASFTDLGDFLAQRMRVYSAGMQVRFAFGISTALRNDILLIDEGIGAGDAAFQEKARQRIESLFEATPIVILASHSEDMINRFCTRSLQMEHGKVIREDAIVAAA